MHWFQSWRRHIGKLFLAFAAVAGLVTLVQILMPHAYDWRTTQRRLDQLQAFVEQLPTPVDDAGWERGLRSWAQDRSLQAACLRSDGTIRVESHPATTLATMLSSVDLSRLQLGDEIMLEPRTADNEKPKAIAVRRIAGVANSSAEAPGSIAILSVAVRGAPRLTLGQLLPIWWTACLGFLAAAALLAIYFRRFDQTIGRFSDAAQAISVGRTREPPIGLSRDPAWQDLSQSFADMEANLGQRDRLMREDRLRVQAVLSSMVEGVLAIDADQRVTVVNESAISLLSLHGDSIIGRYAGEVVRIPSFESALDEARRTQGAVQAEIETVGPRRRSLSIRVTPIATAAATDLAVVLYDTTDLRRLETVRRDFVANVSHELKTPLAAIKAYAETLRLGAIDDKENNRRFLEQIENHAALLEVQVRDLMHLARVESGRAAFDIVDVNLDQICSDCLARFEEEARRREVRLNFAPNESPVVARGDREAIQTVLDNLVSNAIRYTRPGGSVQISTTREHRFAVLAVKDNGIGIAPEHQSRIFERFYRIDKAHSRDVGGTGLGLAIVKHTVQALNGQIDLTSSIGRGSTFRVLLPPKDQSP